MFGPQVLECSGALLQNFTREIRHFCNENAVNIEPIELIAPLKNLNKKWAELTLCIGTKRMEDADEAGLLQLII